MKAIAAILAALLATATLGASIDAEYVSTSVQTLSDGNTIEHRTEGRFAQDSEGRTRFEFGGRVDIVDPVAGVRWTADPFRGQAFRSEIPDGWTDMVDPASDGEIRVSRIGDQSQLPADVPPIPTFGVPDMTELGSATINGLDATGRVYKHTMPAGTIGNTEPITVETKVWWSEDAGIRLPVKTEVRDPINGHSVQELRNIRILESGESAGMFSPDPEWTIVDLPAQTPGINEITER